MKLAYFDCFSGAGGDMIVASLIDAGADPEALKGQLAGLGVTGWRPVIEKVTKQGFAATRFRVELDAAVSQKHRHLRHIREILDGSSLSDGVKQRAAAIFERLAEAEAAVHGTTIEKVHFHEVGAVDAIVDVVGAVLALELLGVERVVCSAIPTGSGTVRCDHGVMPVPAPATAQLLRAVPIARSEETGELTTPTAAAVLTTLSAAFGPMPSMRLESVGYGAGTRDGAVVPNLLRVMVGESAGADEASADEIVVLETNLDDVSPAVIAHCQARLWEAGVLDVFTQPIQMKKLRSGVLLSVLCAPEQAAEVERIIFAETPTFGIRRHGARRSKLARRFETVNTPLGAVRIKVGEREGQVTAAPEYEDCSALARKHGVPLREVLAMAMGAWEEK